jgi:hypothetical protein
MTSHWPCLISSFEIKESNVIIIFVMISIKLFSKNKWRLILSRYGRTYPYFQFGKKQLITLFEIGYMYFTVNLQSYMWIFIFDIYSTNFGCTIQMSKSICLRILLPYKVTLVSSNSCTLSWHKYNFYSNDRSLAVIFTIELGIPSLGKIWLFWTALPI